MMKVDIKNNKGPARTGFRGGFTRTLTFKRKSVCGFTILEALVAISILMVAVVSPITIAQKGLSSASYSKSQMIASYLAQDAIEYIKNVRDENIKAGDSWLKGLEECETVMSSYCQIDTIKEVANPGASVLILGSVLPSTLLINDSGFYGYEGEGTNTNFTRKIKILFNPFGNNVNEALITVTVGWGTDAVEIKTLIYNY
jgi:type II secretory pathway pseudopilin PulG